MFLDYCYSLLHQEMFKFMFGKEHSIVNLYWNSSAVRHCLRVSHKCSPTLPLHFFPSFQAALTLLTVQLVSLCSSQILFNYSFGLSYN